MLKDDNTLLEVFPNMPGPISHVLDKVCQDPSSHVYLIKYAGTQLMYLIIYLYVGAQFMPFLKFWPQL